MYLYESSDPRAHMNNKSIEGDTCILLLSKDCMNMDVKTLNKRKGDEIIKIFRCLLASSTEKICLAYVSSSDNNQVLTMHEYSTTINLLFDVTEILLKVALHTIK